MITAIPSTPAELQSILSAQAIMALGRQTARYGAQLMESVRAGLENAEVPSQPAIVMAEPPALLGL